MREAAKNKEAAGGAAVISGDNDAWIRNESNADANGVTATRNPEAGISGLNKIAREQMKEIREEMKGISNPAAFDRYAKDMESLMAKREAGIVKAAKEQGVPLKRGR